MLPDRITQKYANKNVSLLSTSDVKYVGQLFTIDPDEPSIALKNVQCLGTEGRRSGPHAIAASKNIYEFIRFRVMNIKSLNLDEPDQNKDLNKEILEPLRSHAESSQTQSQQIANKNVNTQRTKSNTSHEESKRKVGGYHAPSTHSPSLYHPQALSPQYDANNPYEYGSTEYYPPLPPSQHQQAHGFIYSPSYPYEVEPNTNFSQNQTYSQIASRPRQPQSSYHRRELNVHVPSVDEVNSGAPNVVNPISNEGYYYQQQSSSPGYGPYTNPQFNNQASRGRYNNQGRNYRQYPRNVGNRNNEYFYSPQTNLNYPYQQTQYNDRPGQQNQGNYGKYQNNNNNQQHYYNQRQRQFHAGPNQNRYNKAANDENQIPGTGAYLDRRIQGDDLDLAVIAKDFEFLSLDSQKEKTTHENNDTTSKTTLTTNANTDAKSSSNKKEGKDVTTNEEVSKETKTKGDDIESNKEQKKNEETKNKDQEQNNSEEKTAHVKPAYDKNKSFFDTITTDADIKKQQKQVNLDEQRQNDVETFGNVAGAYRSRHTINQQNDRNANYRRNDRTFNQRKTNFYGSQQQQGFDNNYHRNTNNNRRQQYFNNNTQQSFDANNNPQKWVQKRSNF